jgi:hypothetical protein
MIPLTRIRTTDKVHKNFHGAKRVQLNLKLLKKKRDNELEEDSKDKWDSSIWGEARPQLLAETHNKCAYCETPAKVVAYGDVEHFRPKSKYWWLAYSYENYLVSCTLCNQKYKKDYFEILDEANRLSGPAVGAHSSDAALEQLAPLMTVDPVTDTAGMQLQDFIDGINKEYALIVNPYFEDPAEYFAYKPILENSEVVIIPAKDEYKQVIKACEDLFGINRQELMDLRFQWYCLYMTFRHTAADPGLSPNTKKMNTNRLKEMTQDFSPYAGMIRFFETKELAGLPWDFDIEVTGGLTAPGT